MKIEVDIPDSIAAQARESASREHLSVDRLIASALTAQPDKSPQRPAVAERARRVDWANADEIPARVPANPPLPGDEPQARPSGPSAHREAQPPRSTLPFLLVPKLHEPVRRMKA